MAIRTIPRKQRSAAPTALLPAAARPPDRLSAEEAELNGDAIETFATALGGRDQLAAVLAVASANPDVDKVINALADSRMRSMSLRRLCHLSGITVADLFAAYKKALFTQAHLRSTAIIAEKLPPIVEDVMARAIPYDQLCPSCHATPPAPEAPPCALCRGTGLVKSEPDLDRQKLALELGQLTEKKAGIIMQQNTVAAAALTSHGVGALESLQQAVGELLFSPTRRRSQSPRQEPRPDALPDSVSFPIEIDIPLPFTDAEPLANAPDDDAPSDPEFESPGR